MTFCNIDSSLAVAETVPSIPNVPCYWTSEPRALKRKARFTGLRTWRQGDHALFPDEAAPSNDGRGGGRDV